MITMGKGSVMNARCTVTAITSDKMCMFVVQGGSYFHVRTITAISINNNNKLIIIITPGTTFTVLSQVISRVHPVYLTNVGQRQVAADPQTRPTNLGCDSAYIHHRNLLLLLLLPVLITMM